MQCASAARLYARMEAKESFMAFAMLAMLGLLETT